jgi:hypothetical protein
MLFTVSRVRSPGHNTFVSMSSFALKAFETEENQRPTCLPRACKLDGKTNLRGLITQDESMSLQSAHATGWEVRSALKPTLRSITQARGGRVEGVLVINRHSSSSIQALVPAHFDKFQEFSTSASSELHAAAGGVPFRLCGLSERVLRYQPSPEDQYSCTSL